SCAKPNPDPNHAGIVAIIRRPTRWFENFLPRLRVPDPIPFLFRIPLRVFPRIRRSSWFRGPASFALPVRLGQDTVDFTVEGVFIAVIEIPLRHFRVGDGGTSPLT